MQAKGIIHNGAGNPFKYFTNGNHHPIFVPDLCKWNGGTSNIVFMSAYRFTNAYYPSTATPPHSNNTNTYFPPTGSYGGGGTEFDDVYWPLHPSGGGMIGDGKWHCWEIILKINSGEGIPDGEHGFWLDGIEIVHVTDLAWQDQGASRNLWNYVQLGGNSNNPFAPASENAEQWYAIDDLVVSTTYVGPDYIIGYNPPIPSILSLLLDL